MQAVGAGTGSASQQLCDCGQVTEPPEPHFPPVESKDNGPSLRGLLGGFHNLPEVWTPM